MLREPLSSTLASLSARFQAERTELLQHLRRDGILFRSPTQPVLSRDGTSARWMLDSLAVTLAPRGAELAGRCILELLKKFEGRQLATYGMTAVPILQSCILQSGGLYSGLLIRKERKKHGSLKLIEGKIDPAEPVVLVDDSISSGTCMTEACERLEEAGLRVEGGVALVRFGWYGGYALMQERGYHVESVYDIWEDFIYHMDGEEKPLRNPSKWFPEFRHSRRYAPERLHPSRLARLVIEEYLSTGELLGAPEQLDKEYDSSGGVWVSVRSSEDIHLRHARDGFWHFPGEERGTTPEDLVMASLRTAVHLPAGDEGLKALAESGIAVTFFPALERCDVGGLDNDRYGIVVRSLERPSWMGGALPRMPGIGNEWEQFQHARRKNGQLISFEPYELFRHEVVKAVEPGTDWQPTGVPLGEQLPWHRERCVCGPVVERARDVVLSLLLEREEKSLPLRADCIPVDLDSVYLTVYVQGRLRGCMGSVVRDLDADIKKLARAALDDNRFAEVSANGSKTIEPADIAVSISLLFAPLVLGYFSPEEVVMRVRQGEQTLMAYQGDHIGLLLPFVASMQNLDRISFARAVLEKAGIEEPPFNWCRFDCTTWLADAVGARLLVGGFPVDEADSSSLENLLERLATLHSDYLLRQRKADGTLYLFYEPFQNRLYEGIETARLAHAAWVLARAGNTLKRSELVAASGEIIDRLSGALSGVERGCWLEPDDGSAPSVGELSFLLLALLELPAGDQRRSVIPSLAATLWSSINPHGRIITHRPPSDSPEDYQDYSPGQVLLALGATVAAGQAKMNEDALRRAFHYYRHRFRYRRHFGQVSWLMQAFARWWYVIGDSQLSDFVFEIGDWILGYQQKKSGGFINDHQPDAPGYTTALYLEGVGAALNLAAACGDVSRRESYLESVMSGFRFLDRLVIQQRDARILPNPSFAIGGLRQSTQRSEVRVDFVQHSLSAVLELYPFVETSRT
ncbi:MAG TPA: AMMECR1 domain-containing protein [Pyrinomonadaceae bacterium]|nr:AMMECR1 domain-containing protein [Pyrinomonadaceae bacterium]